MKNMTTKQTATGKQTVIFRFVIENRLYMVRRTAAGRVYTSFIMKGLN